ncbi:MAG: hypothetical protein JEZ02_20565, partial [Desulfatibacillum sp.]|nr:hypothetical protein [Desulfatibacillum sp.]
MKYTEIFKDYLGFNNVSMEGVLSSIAPFQERLTWCIQFIWAEGDIKKIIGMHYRDLETHCNDSDQGFILSFEKLVDLVKAFKHIVDMTVIAVRAGDPIPNAFKEDNWEEQCQTIVTLDDGSWWGFY